MGEQKNKKVSEEEALVEAEKTLKMLEEKKEESKEKPVEPKAETEKKPAKVAKTKLRSKKPKFRSRKYQEAAKLVDRTKLYGIDEALELVKKTAYTKFPASVELHIRLVLDKKGKPEALRGLINLPHPTGKKINAAVIDEELIAKIQKEKSANFDLLLAKPEMMPKMARIAKILGPKGLMPNPKSGTITSDPEKTLKEIQGGRIEYKTDSFGIIHLIIGKTTDESKKLNENYQALLAVLPINKLQKINVCATMGPSIKIKL